MQARDSLLFLTNDLTKIEENLFAIISKNKKIPEILFGDYIYNLNLLIARLREIAIILLKDIDFEKPAEVDFTAYINTSNNLCGFIHKDVFSSPDTTSISLRIQRWLFVCKLSYQQYDYFTASIIMSALSSIPTKVIKILPEEIFLKLEYYQNLFDKPVNIATKQIKLIQNGVSVIPCLHIIKPLIEKRKAVKQDSSTEAIKEFNRTLSRASSKLFATQSKNLKEVVDTLQSSPHPKFNKKLLDLIDIEETSTVSLTDSLRLDDIHDQYIMLLPIIHQLLLKYDDVSPKQKETHGLLYEMKTALRDIKLTEEEKLEAIRKAYDLCTFKLKTAYGAKLDKKIKEIYKVIKFSLLTIITSQHAVSSAPIPMISISKLSLWEEKLKGMLDDDTLKTARRNEFLESLKETKFAFEKIALRRTLFDKRQTFIKRDRSFDIPKSHLRDKEQNMSSPALISIPTHCEAKRSPSLDKTVKSSSGASISFKKTD